MDPTDPNGGRSLRTGDGAGEGEATAGEATAGAGASSAGHEVSAASNPVAGKAPSWLLASGHAGAASPQPPAEFEATPQPPESKAG